MRVRLRGGFGRRADSQCVAQPMKSLYHRVQMAIGQHESRVPDRCLRSGHVVIRRRGALASPPETGETTHEAERQDRARNSLILNEAARLADFTRRIPLSATKSTLNAKNPPKITAAQRKRLADLAAMPDSKTSCSDIPKQIGEVKWTRPGELISSKNKRQVTLRLDADVRRGTAGIPRQRRRHDSPRSHHHLRHRTRAPVFAAMQAELARIAGAAAP
jgi:hypothetical protein